MSKQYRELDDEERKKYDDMAKKDKERYDEEMKDYTPPKTSGSPGKSKGKKKDPNAPKRATTAFMYFSNAMRKKLKEENPDISFGDLVSIRLPAIVWCFCDKYSTGELSDVTLLSRFREGKLVNFSRVYLKRNEQNTMK